MANYTFLHITAFGAIEDLIQFDKSPPKFKGPDISIYSNEISRTIYSEFKSQATTDVLYGLIGQMQDLSLLVDIETEPGHIELLYKENYRYNFKQLFEIPDFRDEDFFINLNPEYLVKFDKIDITPKIAKLLKDTTIGKVYLDLINNPKYYINI
jgi:hypothetical protein